MKTSLPGTEIYNHCIFFFSFFPTLHEGSNFLPLTVFLQIQYKCNLLGYKITQDKAIPTRGFRRSWKRARPELVLTHLS